MLAETNIYTWKEPSSSSNLLLLLLLIPGVAVIAVIGAVVFLKTKGRDAKPVEELELGTKEEFVPEEPAPAPSNYTMSDEPEYTAAEPQISCGTAGQSGTTIAGPTYVVGGKPVNVVDNGY